jgi:zinc finger FYVE domain-containing protein 26
MQVMFSRLIGHPRLIIESLLMSEQISVLSSLFNEIEELRENSLILSYAKKAITINDHFGSSSRKTTSSEFSSSGNKNTNSLWEDAKRLVKGSN